MKIWIDYAIVAAAAIIFSIAAVRLIIAMIRYHRASRAYAKLVDRKLKS